MFLFKRAQLFIFSLLAMLVLAPAWAQQPQMEPGEDVPTFKLQVVEKKFLPPEMYGTWSIQARTLRSDAPSWMFQTDSHEIWAFARDGDVITLQNLLTNAFAEITVDNVHGNTATFHHVAQIPRGNMEIVEIPTITVQGDRLFGMNIQKITMRPMMGGPLKTYTLEISVEGTRLTGARVRFDGYAPPNPQLIVEPLRRDDR